MIRNVIFDIGQVLMRFDWPGFIEAEVGRETGALLTEAMWNYGVWNELDRGVWSREELLAGFAAHAPGYEKEIRQVYEHVGRACARHDYAIPWLREMKEAGYHVFYLSNYSHYMMDEAPQVLDFLPLMEGGIFSCDVHFCKPDRRIYECLCERYGLIPEECYFIDDNGDNIRAAVEYGMHGSVFESYVKDHDRILNELRTIQ